MSGCEARSGTLVAPSLSRAGRPVDVERSSGRIVSFRGEPHSSAAATVRPACCMFSVQLARKRCSSHLIIRRTWRGGGSAPRIAVDDVDKTSVWETVNERRHWPLPSQYRGTTFVIRILHSLTAREADPALCTLTSPLPACGVGTLYRMLKCPIPISISDLVSGHLKQARTRIDTPRGAGCSPPLRRMTTSSE